MRDAFSEHRVEVVGSLSRCQSRLVRSRVRRHAQAVVGITVRSTAPRRLVGSVSNLDVGRWWWWGKLTILRVIKA